MDKHKLNCHNAGVSFLSAEQVDKKIKPVAEYTTRSEVVSGIGGFNGIFELGKYNNPLIVSSSNGVSTKLKIAIMADKHDTIGIDLVARSVNDIITSGAEPLFFHDYITTGKLDVNKTIEIVKGISKGCKESGCTLIAGDTSEIPGVYTVNNYDLGGFVVGVVEKDELIDIKHVDSGDVIIGLTSTGLHNNGYTMCNKIFFEYLRISPFGYVNCLNRPVFQELLEPTRIYVKAILDLKKQFKIKSIAHITGGGLIRNIPRSLPFDVQANIYNYSWEIPKIFKVIQNMSQLNTQEMLKIFNMGIGMTLIVKQKESKEIIKYINDKYFPAFEIGKISRKKIDSRITFIEK